jgi:hypothetical protein
MVLAGRRVVIVSPTEKAPNLRDGGAIAEFGVSMERPLEQRPRLNLVALKEEPSEHLAHKCPAFDVVDLRLLAAVRIRAKMAKNFTGGRRTGGAAVGCGLSDRKFDCLLPTIGL